MMKHWMLLLGLLLISSPLLLAVEPTPGIAGTWKAEGDNWEITPQRLRANIPGDKVGRTYTVTALERLPADEWTLNFTTIQNHDWERGEIAFVAGQRNQPGGEFRLEYSIENSRAIVKASSYEKNDYHSYAYEYQECCAGSIHQVRMIYQAKTRRCLLVINGQPVRVKDMPASLPTGPVSFNVIVGNGYDKPFSVDFTNVSIEHAAAFPENRPQPGPAFAGWKTLAKPAPAAIPADFGKRMVGIYANPQSSERVRAYVLSAYAIYERATAGQLSDNTLMAINSQCDRVYAQRDTYKTNYGFDLLYPIWIASATDAQRAQAQPKVEQYFGMLTQPSFRIPDGTAAMRRSLLLDPQRSVAAAIQNDPDFGMYIALLRDWPEMPSEQALGLYMGILSQDTRQLNAYAWLQPEIVRVSPAFGAGIKDYLLELAAHRDTLFTTEGDVPFSLGAYRMAPDDLPAALALAESLINGGVQADVYQTLKGMPVGKRIPDIDTRIEQALKTYIIQWKKLRYEQSPVRRYLRLANWYLEVKRQVDGEAVVAKAIPLIAVDDAQTRYGDIRGIALFYKAIKHPDADAWQKKMTEAATEADAGTADRSDDWVHISATNGAVATLVKDGKIDDALALIEKLDADMLPENIANCYAIVIYALSKTDMPRALSLLKRVPPVRQKDSIVQGIAPRLTVEQARALLNDAAAGPQKTAILGAVVPVIAKTNLNEAVTLLKQMPPADRRVALYTIGQTIPLERNADLLQLSAESFTAYIAQTKGYSRDSRYSFYQALSGFTPATLMALEPAFATDQEFYVRVMVNATAKACGLSSDPLWLRIANPEFEYRTNPIYWGGTVFTDAVRSYTEDMKKAAVQENPR